MNQVNLDDSFQLKINETKYVGNFAIEFLNVTEDSRCPTDEGVVCSWAGRVAVEINIKTKGQDFGNFNLMIGALTNESDYRKDFGVHTIELKKVDPPSKVKKTPLSDYVATFIVSKNEDYTITEDGIDKVDISICVEDSDCIIVPYSDCCGSTKKAINKQYLDDYNEHPEWQVFNDPEICDLAGRCPNDSDVVSAKCELKRCQFDWSDTTISVICGDGICEEGEADDNPCPVDMPEPRCMMPFQPGTCPSDCS